MPDDHANGASSAARIIAALRELIAAIDRRVPRGERPDERTIASDAALLRSAAVRRLDELNQALGKNVGYDPDLVEAIMSDDGGHPGRRGGRS